MGISIAALLGALAIGLSLGLLGSGGSVVTVPVLIYLLGMDEKAAIAGSLFVVGSIALTGGLQFLGKGRIHWRSVVVFGLPGMAGTWLGAVIAGYVPGIVQLALFALVMIVAAWLMLKPPDLSKGSGEARATWKIALDGLAVGVVTGLVGVGGGFLIVPALVLLGGLAMHAAVATSLLVIALKSYSGFIKYLDVLAAESLSLDWRVLGIVTTVGIVGSLIGGRIGSRLPQQTLRTGFGWFLVAMAVYILIRSTPELMELVRA